MDSPKPLARFRSNIHECIPTALKRDIDIGSLKLSRYPNVVPNFDY